MAVCSDSSTGILCSGIANLGRREASQEGDEGKQDSRVDAIFAFLEASGWPLLGTEWCTRWTSHPIQQDSGIFRERGGERESESQGMLPALRPSCNELDIHAQAEGEGQSMLGVQIARQPCRTIWWPLF